MRRRTCFHNYCDSERDADEEADAELKMSRRFPRTNVHQFYQITEVLVSLPTLVSDVGSHSNGHLSE